MSEHYIAKCKHGILVSQCRCPSPNKTVRLVACPPSCARVQRMEEAAERDDRHREIGRLVEALAEQATDWSVGCEPNSRFEVLFGDRPAGQCEFYGDTLLEALRKASGESRGA